MIMIIGDYDNNFYDEDCNAIKIMLIADDYC